MISVSRELQLCKLLLLGKFIYCSPGCLPLLASKSDVHPSLAVRWRPQRQGTASRQQRLQTQLVGITPATAKQLVKERETALGQRGKDHATMWEFFILDLRRAACLRQLHKAAKPCTWTSRQLPRWQQWHSLAFLLHTVLSPIFYGHQ